jgi:starch-binding outer membrane protein, SusD/RagB family
MNTLKRLTYILLAASLTFVGCERFTEGFETDPNNPADADPNNMIQGVMLADILFHTGELPRLTGMWINQFTGEDRQYIALDTWQGAPAATFDGPWALVYSGVVANSRIVQEKTTDNRNYKLRGVAKVLEAHALGTATALWGDIPNTEAANVEEFSNPSYDSQESVYAYVQTTLSSAIEDLEDIGGIPGEKDIIYAGDVGKWIRLAHALKARYYMHVRNYAQAEAEAALGLQSTDDDMIAPFGDVYGGSFNPWYSFLVYDRPGYMGAGAAYAPRLLDPNAEEYRGNAKTNEYGRFYWNYHDFGIYTDTYEPNYLNTFDWGEPNGRFGEAMPLVTYGEMLLIQAEAQLRQGGTGFLTALETYNEYRNYLETEQPYFGEVATAYEVPVKYEAYLPTDFIAGGIANPTGLSLENALLREILLERYIHFIGHLEAFNDLRRISDEEFGWLGIPVKGGGTRIAQRLLYPQTEINANPSTPSPVPDYTTPTPVNN